MPQFINSNIASLNSQRALNSSQGDLSTTLERLSSGLRINSAKDDAAGLAITDRMTSQIRGMNQAVRNANDGISLAQTAESALASTSDNLQRIRELSIQSANSTNSASDRKALNTEVNQLIEEIQRVGVSTQFNGQNLLDGSFQSAQFQVGANANQTLNVGIAGSTTNLLGSYQASSTAVDTNAFDGDSFTINSIEIGVSAGTSAAGFDDDSAAAKAAAINNKSNETGVSATATSSVTGIAPITGAGLDTGDLVINGISIGSIAKSGNAVTQGGNAATAINAESNETGVTATASAVTGALTLTASDGRNISLTSSTATGDSATKIFNSVGLDISDGDNPSGNDTQDLVFAAGGAFADSGTPADGDIAEGDTITIDSIVYEFTTETQDQVTAGGSTNIAVTLIADDTVNTNSAALAAAITGQRTAGNTTVSASDTTGTVTLTQDKLGDAGDQQIGYVESNMSLGAAGIAQGTVSAAGTDAVDGNGVTTFGTMTLSSAENFTLGGDDLAFGGLSGASTSLTKLESVDISTVAGANSAINVLDGALSQISTQQAELGAMQNRFSSTIDNLASSVENLSSARSQIRDADFAAETAELSRNQILQQAGIAMLSQANSAPQNVLSLLQ
jgi:flagellin